MHFQHWQLQVTQIYMPSGFFLCPDINHSALEKLQQWGQQRTADLSTKCGWLHTGLSHSSSSLLWAVLGRTRPWELGCLETSSYASQENLRPQEPTVKPQLLSCCSHTLRSVSTTYLSAKHYVTRADSSSPKHWVWDSAGEALHELNGASADEWGIVLNKSHMGPPDLNSSSVLIKFCNS